MRGQDQHRQRVAALAQAAQHLQPIESRQAEVQDQQGVVLGAQQAVGAAAVVHAVDREAGLAQSLV
ncbi:hypothetical protein D3C81_2244970 [compost metagenome]